MGEFKTTLLYRDECMDTISVITGGVQSVLQVTEGLTTRNPLRAVVALPTDDAAKAELLTTLAAEMGIRIEAMSPLEKPPLGPCVTAEYRDEAAGEDVLPWRVSGDIHDGLTDEEIRRCMRRLGLEFGINHWMSDHLLEDHPIDAISNMVFDPESGCFFAYGSEADARSLAEYINGKSWIPAE